MLVCDCVKHGKLHNFGFHVFADPSFGVFPGCSPVSEAPVLGVPPGCVTFVFLIRDLAEHLVVLLQCRFHPLSEFMRGQAILEMIPDRLLKLL